MSRSMTLGKTLKSVRKEKKFTLEGVSLEVGISVPYLSDVENDKVNISFEKLETLVNFYGYELTIIKRRS